MARVQKKSVASNKTLNVARSVDIVVESYPLPPVDLVSTDPADLGDMDGTFMKGVLAALVARDRQRAMTLCDAHLNKYPQYPHVLNFRGALSLQQKDPSGAEPFINRAYQTSPKDPRIINNLACLHILKGNNKTAVDMLHRLDTPMGHPYAAYYYNMALAAGRLGDLVRARQALVRSLEREELVEAIILEVMTHTGEDQVGYARSRLEQTLKGHPTSVLVQYYLALVRFVGGDVIEALPYALAAVNQDPSDPYTAGLLSRIIRFVSFAEFKPGVLETIARVLDNPFVNASQFESAWKSLISLCPPWNHWCGLPVQVSDDEMINWLTAFESACEVTRFVGCAGIKNILIHDSYFERALTVLRHVFLEHFLGRRTFEMSESKRTLLIALAHQCALNEYVYFVTDQENKDCQVLRQSLDLKAPKGLPEDQLDRLLILMCYKPLFDWGLRDEVMRFTAHNVLEPFIQDQIQAREREQDLIQKIPALTPIRDAVSKRVAEMYTENPYPRWHGCNFGGSMLYLSLSPHKKDRVQALVAGCGTGQHAMIVALRNKNCQVTAIDLSLVSLAYARRKTEEMGITNIDYAQADILELGTWDKSFDLIESAGVLHHLADPMQGLDTLLSLLKPGGRMRLGLYSEIARVPIVAARAEIAQRNILPTPQNIRAYRHEVLMSDPTHPAYDLQTRGDFYTMSTCRDLIFHVQETRYTIPEIKNFLSRRGLVFEGFDLSPLWKKAFSDMFPEKDSDCDLDLWDVFEHKNPATFNSMYQFWVKKPL